MTSLLIYAALFSIVLALSLYVYVNYVNSYERSAAVKGKYLKKVNSIIDKNKLINIVLIICASILLSIFLGVRAKTVGADTTSTYWDYYCNYILTDGTATGEIGFYFLCKIAYAITGSYNGILFLIALVTCTLTLFGIYTYFYDKKLSYVIGVFVYLFLLYAPAVNIMRQMIVVSIEFFALDRMFKRQFFRYVILVLAAMLFHTSAIILLPIYFIYSKNKVYKIVVACICVAFCVILLTQFASLFSFLTKLNIFQDYSRYEGFLIDNSQNIKLGALSMLKSPIYLLYFINLRNNLKSNDHSYVFYLFLVIEVATSMLSGYLLWAFRLMYYFSSAHIYLAGITVNSVKQKYGNKSIFYYITIVVIICYYIVYFYIAFCVWGHDGIFPYSTILD